MKKIAFAGTDGRTLLCALVTATATSEIYQDEQRGGYSGNSRDAQILRNHELAGGVCCHQQQLC
jgi:hypothetical protein